MKPVLLVLGPVIPSTYKYALTAMLMILPVFCDIDPIVKDR